METKILYIDVLIFDSCFPRYRLKSITSPYCAVSVYLYVCVCTIETATYYLFLQVLGREYFHMVTMIWNPAIFNNNSEETLDISVTAVLQ